MKIRGKKSFINESIQPFAVAAVNWCHNLENKAQFVEQDV